MGGSFLVLPRHVGRGFWSRCIGTPIQRDYPHFAWGYAMFMHWPDDHGAMLRDSMRQFLIVVKANHPTLTRYRAALSYGNAGADSDNPAIRKQASAMLRQLMDCCCCALHNPGPAFTRPTGTIGTRPSGRRRTSRFGCLGPLTLLAYKRHYCGSGGEDRPLSPANGGIRPQDKTPARKIL